MYQFYGKVEWRDHISDYFRIFEKYVRSLYKGTSPKCLISRSHCPNAFKSAQQVKFHLQNNHGAEFVKTAKKSRPLDKVDAGCPKTKRVRGVIKRELEAKESSEPAYEFVYQTAEQWSQKARAPVLAPIPLLLSRTSSTAPSTAPSTPPLLNSRALTPVTEYVADECDGATYVTVSQVSNTNDNIDLLLLLDPAPVGDNTMHSPSSVTGTSEVCTIVSEHDVIELVGLTDLGDQKSQALEP
jgi:hypothetical protein